MRQAHYTTPQDISRAIELAQETASLDLLRVIEHTIKTLAVDVHNFDEDVCQLHEIANKIKAEPVRKGVFLDPEDRASNILNSAEENLKNHIPMMVMKRSAIDRDDNLSTDHRESLHDGYDRWIVSAAYLLDALKLVRLCIIEHDEDAATASFIELVDKEMSHRPDSVVPADKEQLNRIAMLVANVQS